MLQYSPMDTRFLPTTPEEVRARGWEQLGRDPGQRRQLHRQPVHRRGGDRARAGSGRLPGGHHRPAGYRPPPADITRLGEPRLFWGVTGGSVDSMVANYTASKKRASSDDYTPGGENNRRPDRAVIVYTNLIRRYFKNTRPIVLGGIEATLRRVAHYDFWSDAVRALDPLRRQGRLPALRHGRAIRAGTGAGAARRIATRTQLRGLCYIARDAARRVTSNCPPSRRSPRISWPSSTCSTLSTTTTTRSPPGAWSQRHGDRYLVQNPPAPYPTQAELDAVYALPYQRAQHPYYERQGPVKALETIRFSITTHRGCYGECNFCAIAVHEGRTVRWRSPDFDRRRRPNRWRNYPGFKGYIQDVGGPTANMYGFECRKKLGRGVLRRQALPLSQRLPGAETRPRARRSSCCAACARSRASRRSSWPPASATIWCWPTAPTGMSTCKEMVEHHVSGQLKIAPEHTEDRVLARWASPGRRRCCSSSTCSTSFPSQARKEQYLTYYLIAAHPGCTEADMHRLKQFASAGAAHLPRAGADLHPLALHLFQPDVLHRSGPLLAPAAVRRERPGAARAPEADRGGKTRRRRACRARRPAPSPGPTPWPGAPPTLPGR